MKSDDRLIITPEEAGSLIPDGEYIHNFVNPAPSMFIGCNYERADAIKAFRDAREIEIAGFHCRSMKHPIAVHHEDGRLSFFAADMEKLKAFETEKGVEL